MPMLLILEYLILDLVLKCNDFWMFKDDILEVSLNKLLMQIHQILVLSLIQFGLFKFCLLLQSFLLLFQQILLFLL